MGKIKSITEAFSMQPATIETKEQFMYDNALKANPKYAITFCKEIKAETLQVDSDKACNFYVGYNFNGDKMFEYLQSSVNVHYETLNPSNQDQ